MTTISVAMAAGMALLMAVPVATMAQQPAAAESWDGLVEVNARRLDAAFLAPGADFRPYTKVMLEEPQVAFRENWMRDVNRGTRSARGRVTEGDAARILASVSASNIDLFTRAFTDAGFEVVTREGPDVLRVRTDVINLVVNAPETMTAGRSMSFTPNAGEATLVLEARDSMTRALLARVIDRCETRNVPGRANRVTNTADFRALANDWARIAANRLNVLKESSPVPESLVPGQRLP